MHRNLRSRTPRRALAVLLLAIGGAGCASSVLDSSAQAPSITGTASSFRERMSALFFGPSGPAPEQGPNVDPNDDCPVVDIRQGASTMQFTVPGQEPAATNLRYQVSIARTARECAVRAPSRTVKVGVLGRVILGPAGGPGRIDVPLRIALVREGPEPKTIWTKLYTFPVSIPDGQANVPFMHVEEDITFPIPRRDELDAYVVYVGFDPAAKPEQPRRSKGGRGRAG